MNMKIEVWHDQINDWSTYKIFEIIPNSLEPEDKPILGFDFDDTVCTHSWPDIGKAKQKLIHKIVCWYIKRKGKQGYLLSLQTMREDKPLKSEDFLSDAVNYLASIGIVPDLINENPSKNEGYYGHSRKMAHDIYIDDKNIGLIGWLLTRAKEKQDV